MPSSAMARVENKKANSSRIEKLRFISGGSSMRNYEELEQIRGKQQGYPSIYAALCPRGKRAPHKFSLKARPETRSARALGYFRLPLDGWKVPRASGIRKGCNPASILARSRNAKSCELSERRMSSASTTHAPKGLEGIVATNSKICYIDGDRGVLAYGGIDIHELADHSNFEETCYLLWFR